MKYTNKEKEYLNKIFKYTRKINKTPIKEIISKTGISTSTYYQLEKGHISKDEIYDKLINAFNLKYVPFDGAISYFEDKVITIQKLVEYLDIDSLTRELDEIENKFKKYDKYAFYNNALFIVKTTKNYFIKNIYPDKKQWFDLYTLYDECDVPLKYLIIEILSIASWNSINETVPLIREKFMEDFPVYLYSMKSSYMMKDHYLESLLILMNNIDYLSENPIREIRFIIKIYNRIYDIDFNKSLEYKERIINLLNKNILPNKEGCSALHSLMVKGLIEKDYFFVVKLYEEYINYHNPYNTVFYIIALNSLNAKIDIGLIDETIDHNSCDYNILRYIKMKQSDTSIIDLEKFLLSNVIISLKNSGSILPYWPIFFDELEKIVTKTRNYKSLLTFKKEMDKMK